jgi:acyl-coenzyme A thioesterase PaaI-like protein
VTQGDRIGHTPLQRLLGVFYLDDLDNPPTDGSATVQGDVRDDFKGPAGSMEGGLVATLIDTAAWSPRSP